MAQEETQLGMSQMMETMIASMSADDKKEMMKGMIGKLTEGVDMNEMVPMMMSMMGSKGGMKKKMAKMMEQGEEGESMMPEMMLTMMMPHCIKMMMPAISKDKRSTLASKLVSTIVDQASSGMSAEEKASFVSRVVESVMVKVLKT